MPDIQVKINQRDLKVVLGRYIRKLQDQQPLMDDIGEYMVRSTQNRILRQKVSPEGDPWAPLKESTIKRKGHSSILFETGNLARNIHVAQTTRTGVTIESPDEYGEYMQEGFTIRRKGRLKKVPARPYMGISEANVKRIQSLVRDYYSNGS